MKRLAAILFVTFAFAESRAQVAPLLQSKVGTNGVLTITWPVQRIVNVSTNLHACYQIEVANTLGEWIQQGPLLRGEKFPNRIGSAVLENAPETPASFFRVRAVFDFTGGQFINKSIQNITLTNSIFTGANFFGAQLSGSTFDNADLAAADFRFSNMTEVSAQNADFTLARMSDVDLTSANLTGAKLLLTDLSGATLAFADLSGADLRGAVLQDNDSNFTRLHNTTIDPTTIFDRRSLAIWIIVNGQGANRNFTDVDLSFADLSDGNLSKAKLIGLDLSGADLRNTDLTDADLTDANLRLLDLRGTIISAGTQITNKWRVISDIINNPQADRSHTNTDLTLGFWIGATFERADVRNSQFNSGVMSEVNFEGAKASAARFNNVEFHGVNFKNATLTGANFSQALLDNVNFLGANLTNAIFLGATFNNTTMPDGTIRN
jgi:uncharacterized protein YjbI with pentapeptide repeats